MGNNSIVRFYRKVESKIRRIVIGAFEKLE